MLDGHLVDPCSLCDNEIKTIKIKYKSEDYPDVKKILKGDWIDLYIDEMEFVRETWYGKALRFFGFALNTVFKGETVIFNLGVAMELPAGYEAYVLPRSSTFKKTGLLLANSIGVIDNLYHGDTDYYLATCYATRKVNLERHQRLFQFRIQENQPPVRFKEVDFLDNEDRGGIGSTD